MGHFILHSAELHIGSSIRYENALYVNYFLDSYIVKRILISFNCFSEYITNILLKVTISSIAHIFFWHLGYNCG